MKNKILSILFFLFVSTFLVLNIITKDNDISDSERRKLAKLPEITLDNMLNGKISNNFESYALDQFVYRDSFRKIKTNTDLKILRKQDYNNLYIKDNYIFKIEYPLKEKRIELFNKKMNILYDTYFKDTKVKVYYSIIPDKTYYDNSRHLKLDYNKLFESVNNINPKMKYIDIRNSLTLEDYYYTDIHWKQENLTNVVKTLSEEMKFKVYSNYEEKFYEPFYGSYYGQINTKVKPDTLKYLSNKIIENATVRDTESNLNTVYETSSLGKKDSYDVFLSGATPYVEIINNNTKSKKELIIFRDSFGSSLAPLLLYDYKKITLVDLRYMSSEYLSEYITFKDQDILLIYNTGIVNNSDMLKIKSSN